MSVTEGLLGSVNLQNKQSKGDNDEERLEQMSHPPKKVMERMTPKRWNGLAWFPYLVIAWFCLVQYERLLKGLYLQRCHQCASKSDMGAECASPKHNAFDLPNHFHFFQGQAMESACKSAQRESCAGNHPRSTKADVLPRTPFWIVLCHEL